ncbi:MAG: hypothetical protein AABX13_01790 [Nanoarchaeota archaeon]
MDKMGGKGYGKGQSNGWNKRIESTIKDIDRYGLLLLLLMLFFLGLRLYFAFTIPNFTYESYFHLRQVDQIRQTGLPLFNDPLSYGGRELRFLPLFHYLAAFFSLFLPLELVGKLLPNVLWSLLPLIVYLIGKKIEPGSRAGTILAAFISGLLPILFQPNSFTPVSLFIPLLFLTIYGFLSLPRKLYLYLISFFLLSFTSSAAVLLLLGFGLYLLLSRIEGKIIPKTEIELILTSLFFFLWVQFLFFKRTLLNEGIAFIWQNIPSPILTQYFPQFTIGQAIIAISIIPFFAGIFVVYRALFQLKNQKSFLLISFVVSTTLVTWFRLIQFKLALAFFGVILAILFASFYRYFTFYLRKTKLHRWAGPLSLTLFLILAVTLIPPAIANAQQQATPQDTELAAFHWLQEHTPVQATVLASLEEGHLVTWQAQRKNLMGDQFALIPDVKQRFQALQALFTSSFLTEAIDLTDKYGINYIVLTPHAQQKYQLIRPKYYTIGCFERVYNQNETRIYRVRCSLQEIIKNEAN